MEPVNIIFIPVYFSLIYFKTSPWCFSNVLYFVLTFLLFLFFVNNTIIILRNIYLLFIQNYKKRKFNLIIIVITLTLFYYFSLKWDHLLSSTQNRESLSNILYYTPIGQYILIIFDNNKINFITIIIKLFSINILLVLLNIKIYKIIITDFDSRNLGNSKHTNINHLFFNILNRMNISPIAKKIFFL